MLWGVFVFGRRFRSRKELRGNCRRGKCPASELRYSALSLALRRVRMSLTRNLLELSIGITEVISRRDVVANEIR
jgi:hypothetical protein